MNKAISKDLREKVILKYTDTSKIHGLPTLCAISFENTKQSTEI